MVLILLRSINNTKTTIATTHKLVAIKNTGTVVCCIYVFFFLFSGMCTNNDQGCVP